MDIIAATSFELLFVDKKKPQQILKVHIFMIKFVCFLTILFSILIMEIIYFFKAVRKQHTWYILAY